MWKIKTLQKCLQHPVIYDRKKKYIYERSLCIEPEILHFLENVKLHLKIGTRLVSISELGKHVVARYTSYNELDGILFEDFFFFFAFLFGLNDIQLVWYNGKTLFQWKLKFKSLKEKLKSIARRKNRVRQAVQLLIPIEINEQERFSNKSPAQTTRCRTILQYLLLVRSSVCGGIAFYYTASQE